MLSFADGVTIQVGHNVWSTDLNLIQYLIIAAIVGVIAEMIIGWKLPQCKGRTFILRIHIEDECSTLSLQDAHSLRIYCFPCVIAHVLNDKKRSFAAQTHVERTRIRRESNSR
jgi:tetrahydromethanopterin S-methyltransferase subunit C